MRVISYTKKFDFMECPIAFRNERYWQGEVEEGFTHIISTDERILRAYKEAGVDEYVAKKKKTSVRKKTDAKKT